MNGLDPSSWGGAPSPTPAPPPQMSPAQTVLVKNDDGDVYKVPAANVTSMLATKKYTALTPDEVERHQVHKEEEAKGIGGSIASGLDSAFNQALLGVPEAIEEHLRTPAEQHHADLVHEEHSVARGIGGAGGFGLSALLTGGLSAAGEGAAHVIIPAAEAAEASLGRRLAAKAVDYATQGALASTPVAIVHAAFGDPKQAAETLFWGLGIGAALGGGTELLGTGVNAAKAAIGKSLDGSLDRTASNLTSRVVGASKAQIKKAGPEWAKEVTDFAHAEGLVKAGASRDELAKAIEEARPVYGKRVGEAIDALDKEMGIPETTAKEPLPQAPVRRSPEEIAEYLRDNPDTAFGADGKLPDEVAFKSQPKPQEKITVKTDSKAAAKAIQPGEIGSKLAEAFDLKELSGPVLEKSAKAVQDVIDQANLLPIHNVGGQDVIAFRDANKLLEQLRKAYSGAIGKGYTPNAARPLMMTPEQEVQQTAYHVVRNFVNEASERFVAATDDPKQFAKLADAKKDFAKLATLDSWAANVRAEGAAARPVQMPGLMHMGLPSTVTTGIGSAIGGFPGAMVGKAVGVPLDYLAKRWVENKGLVYLSSLAKKAAGQGPDVFSAVLGAEGQQRLASTLDTVGEAVHRLAIRGIEPTRPRDMSHVGHMLDGAEGLSHEQAYDKLTSRIGTLASNPEALVQVAGALSSPYAVSAPHVAEAYRAQLTRGVQYLAASVPKPPTPKPFQPNTWKPSDAQKMTFHDKAQVVNNPASIIDHMTRGTLSPAHIEAMAAVYPRTLERMRVEVLKFAAEHPDVHLPYTERQSVGRLLGHPLDTVPPPSSGSEPASGQSPETPKRKPKLDNLPSQGTTFSRSMSPSESP